MDKSKLLDNLFAQKIFRVPDYQRGYKWQINKPKNLWEDLINLSDQLTEN